MSVSYDAKEQKAIARKHGQRIDSNGCCWLWLLRAYRSPSFKKHQNVNTHTFAMRNNTTKRNDLVVERFNPSDVSACVSVVGDIWNVTEVRPVSSLKPWFLDLYYCIEFAGIKFSGLRLKRILNKLNWYLKESVVTECKQWVRKCVRNSFPVKTLRWFWCFIVIFIFNIWCFLRKSFGSDSYKNLVGLGWFKASPHRLHFNFNHQNLNV